MSQEQNFVPYFDLSEALDEKVQKATIELLNQAERKEISPKELVIAFRAINSVTRGLCAESESLFLDECIMAGSEIYQLEDLNWKQSSQ